MFAFLYKIFAPKRKPIEILNYEVSEEDFEKFIYNWNIDNPVDRWYRQKYDIKFNSPEHRILSFIDMIFEYKEDKIYNQILDREDKYIKGDFIKEREISDKDLPSNEDLMQLDFSKFDD